MHRYNGSSRNGNAIQGMGFHQLNSLKLSAKELGCYVRFIFVGFFFIFAHWNTNVLFIDVNITLTILENPPLLVACLKVLMVYLCGCGTTFTSCTKTT